MAGWTGLASTGLALALMVACSTSGQADELPWYKTSVVYQIYPRSFADSDGDGNGDLKGIMNHVDYLKDLGVGVVWLSPIYKSPMKDNGYDVSNFTDVNVLFGTLEDAKNLIKAFHDKGMKFFMDFVPNHSSEEHAWFNASKHRADGKEDYYIWRDPLSYSTSNPQPPNNWVNVFDFTSGWTFEPLRNQFYYRAFGSYQPDLNYNNEAVVTAMYQNMKFWLDLGVDGFRMDAVPFLAEDTAFRDEQVKPNCKPGAKQDCLIHSFTQNLDRTYGVLRQFEDWIERDFNNTKFLFYEVYATPEQTMRYYYKQSSPFNFIFIQDLRIDTNATYLKKMIDDYMSAIPNNMWPNWVTGNHDNSRVGTRMGEDFIDAANMMVLLLPGTTITYQGEELGMTDTHVPPQLINDCCGRDPERTPFQWNSSTNAGFSNGTKTWLPVNPNYSNVNAKKENTSESSHLNTYKRLLKLHSELIESTNVTTAAINDWVFAFKRENKGKQVYVVINLNNKEENVTLTNAFDKIPNELSVHTPSDNSGYKINDKINTKSFLLKPRAAVVLSSSSMFRPLFLIIFLSSFLSYVFNF